MIEHFVELDDGLRMYCAEHPSASSNPSCPPILCLAGLTRNSRDFSSLAPWLASDYRVLAPDLRGRGRSDRDQDWRRYRLDVYLSDIRQLLHFFGISKVVVLGTSLGGLIGLCLGSTATPVIDALILNDIGPELDPVGLQRIAGSVGTATPATSWEEAASQLAAGHREAMPDYSAQDWLRFAHRLCREEAPGVIVRDMDPLLGRALRESGPDIPDFWATYQAQPDERPILALRGELSDLLSVQTVARMQTLRSTLQTATIPQRGHTPTLDEPESRRALAQFLDACFGSMLSRRL